ncbi:MAG: hypothetical protein IPL91_15090 [Hyphomicrobium sp.]|nr:hypothetical protein [Hyphomicrobium sp.]
MHRFPPGFIARIAIVAGCVTVCAMLIGATFLGGRPSLREEQQRTLDSLKVRDTARRQNERSLRGLK